MNVDPVTRVQRLLDAFPAARANLRRLGIDVTSNETLYTACEEAGIKVADVQAALANIDWTRSEEDSPDVDAAGSEP